MTSFLVPLFFVLVGFRTSITALGSPSVLILAVALSAAAVIGKLLCALGVLKAGIRKGVVAAGMIPRGEVTLVFAALGSTLQVGQTPLLDARGDPAIVAVVIITTLITPPALKWTMRTAAESRGGSPSPRRG